MIHASRRDKAGMAEVHTLDTDLIYVMEGSGTFVTGGTMVDGKNIAPDEIRGASIRNGESRHLVKGDVIIVPADVPHWFQEVNAPVAYYVVKVR
ncbi:MAG TPA: cupin domain-containing protein [Chthonomonadaceae bacterium]|jgi:quercetin dioxygenase-like cupin family protein|nr:cupin domain-containing protein [Chthonomonadaceae bacterium]